MAMDFPTYTKNATVPTQTVDLTPPAVGALNAGDGNFTVAINTTRGATLTLASDPAPAPYDDTDGYTVDWGDGTVVTDLAFGAVDGQTHTYGSNGSKTVTLSGPYGYSGTKTFTVTNGATGSHVGTVAAHPTVEELAVHQQWRDADLANLGARHPLSLNRDNTSFVTTDPYTT